MDPNALETLAMLRLSEGLWDAREVDEAMKRATRPEIEITGIAPASSTPAPR